MINTTRPKPFVFVLMPFDKVYNDIYRLGIKAACQEAATFCERVDEQIFTDSILDRIYNQIAKADLIISDMTGRNPNVFYETGYAHALGKQVILLTQKVEDIPFDMKHYPHIIYQQDDITKLNSEITKRVRWLIENPDSSLKHTDLLLEFYCEGNLVTDSSIYEVQFINMCNSSESRSFYLIDFQFQLHNPTELTINLDDIQIGFIGPWLPPLQIDSANEVLKQQTKSTAFQLSSTERIVMLPQGEMYLFLLPKTLLPSGWITLSCRLGYEKIKSDAIDTTLRVFSRIGPRDQRLKVNPDYQLFSFKYPKNS